MRRIPGLVLTAIACGLLAPVTGPSAQAAEGPGIAARAPAAGPVAGEWLVGDRSEPERTLGAGRRSITVRFDLPPETKQGSGVWFTFRLRAQVVLHEAPKAGTSAQLGALTNGHGAAMSTFRAQPPHGVQVFDLGLVTGARTRMATGRTVTVDLENYVQQNGVQSGRNSYEIRLDDTGHLVDRVTVDAVSGLTRTAISPYQLSLSAPEVVRAEAGKDFGVPYELSRRKERADRPLAVTVEKAGGPITFGSEKDQYDGVADGRRGRFTGRAAEPGDYQIRLTADGFNRPSKVVLVHVEQARGWGPGPLSLLAAAVLVAIGVAALRRREPGARPGRP